MDRGGELYFSGIGLAGSDLGSRHSRHPNIDRALVDAYQFNGTAGERLFFDGLGANVGATWYLYAPNNTALGSAGIGSDFEITLNQSGAYYVVVWGTAATPVSYSVKVVTLEEPESALTFGASVSGSIADPGDHSLHVQRTGVKDLL